MNKCFVCANENKEEYQVMIFSPYLMHVECCSMECANRIKNENKEILYDKYRTIRDQCIQRTK